MSDSKCLFETLLEYVSNDIDNDTLEKKMWEEFGQTCAVLVLDSTGFSRTTQKKGIIFFLSIIAQMRKKGRTVFSRHGVTGLRTESDNLFAEFPTVEQAIQAAFDMHQYFEDNQIMLDDAEPYQVCVGIGYGKLLKSAHEGMYGDEMNLASKLGEDIAHGGQTLITEAAFQTLPNRNHLSYHKKVISVSGVELTYFDIKQKQPPK